MKRAPVRMASSRAPWSASSSAPCTSRFTRSGVTPSSVTTRSIVRERTDTDCPSVAAVVACPPYRLPAAPVPTVKNTTASTSLPDARPSTKHASHTQSLSARFSKQRASAMTLASQAMTFRVGSGILAKRLQNPPLHPTSRKTRLSRMAAAIHPSSLSGVGGISPAAHAHRHFPNWMSTSLGSRPMRLGA